MTLELELPWPPSVNHYYRHVGPRVLISRDGRKRAEIPGIGDCAREPERLSSISGQNFATCGILSSGPASPGFGQRWRKSPAGYFASRRAFQR